MSNFSVRGVKNSATDKHLVLPFAPNLSLDPTIDISPLASEPEVAS